MNEKQKYLEIYKMSRQANEKIENECDVFERLNSEIQFVMDKNSIAMAHAENMLKRYCKTFSEEIAAFCKK